MLADGLTMMYGLDRPPMKVDDDLGEPQLRPLFEELAAASFGGGLYRVHTPDLARLWTEKVEECFPEFADRVVCFACDWLGRQFALDRERRDGRRYLVTLLEPGTGDALEIPATIATLHTDELVQNGDAALALDFYADWREASGDDDYLELYECVGYGVPLFLGGADEVSNLGRIDMYAYWSVAAQLRHGESELPRGTTIHDVEFEDEDEDGDG